MPTALPSRQETSTQKAILWQSEQACTQNFCARCQNYATCKRIFLQLKNFQQTPYNATFKKVLKLKEHLYRDGYNFPSVTTSQSCWLHDKAGVISYLEQQLKEYLVV